MKTDDFRQSLDTLAGEDPSVADGLARVTKKVRGHRVRTWSAVATACVVVIAVATVGVVRRGNAPHRISLGTASLPKPGPLAKLSWTRVDTPTMIIRRVTTIGDTTYGVGSSADGTPAIGEIDASGRVANVVNPTRASYDQPLVRPGAGEVDDLVAFRGALIAIGSSTPTGAYAAAWRSTDDGHTWEQAHVAGSSKQQAPFMARLVVADGVLYAIGWQEENCAVVWTSTDGLTFDSDSALSTCSGPLAGANGPDGIVVAGEFNATAWTHSAHGWSPHRVPSDAADPDAQILGLAGSNDGYVAVGSFHETGTKGTEQTAAIWWSANGHRWTRVASQQAPPQSSGQAAFTEVTHSPAGWIAVGWQVEAGTNLFVTDAIVSTSGDGRHWTSVKRDGDVFEQRASAVHVGATTRGFVISGTANLTDPGTPVSGGPQRGTAITRTRVLWIGSASGTATTGTIEGTLQEIGGRMRGPRPVAGTAVVTGPAGERRTVPVDAAGRFSIELPPGRYTVIGHSPVYGSGTYDCGTHDGKRAVVETNRIARVQLVCRIR